MQFNIYHIYMLPNMSFTVHAQHGAHQHMNLPGKLFIQHMLCFLTNCYCILCSDISAVIPRGHQIPVIQTDAVLNYSLIFYHSIRA